ncbi:MAG: protein-L-isoaspartate O-methyltransferase family protein [Terriglobales bacterium]
MERDEFARSITAHAGWPPADTRLLEAFRATPRERFLPPGTSPALIYSNTTVGLGLHGINNGQPSLHAMCLAALQPQTGETALHIGAGTGYYTAILAHLVGPRGRVEAYEVEPRLADQARRNLAGLPQGHVQPAPGAYAPLPACDIIYVNCGATGPAPAWLDALRPGGRLLFPLTGDAGSGAMLLLLRPPGAASLWPARFLLPVLFVDCAGGLRDRSLEPALTLAFGRGGTAAVRRFGRGVPSPPPARLWCAGNHWWLQS